MDEMIFTLHAKEVCKRLKINHDLVLDILATVKPYASKNHEGQWRYCGKGWCVVTEGSRIITIYRDRVITPLRKEQIEAGVKIKRTK